MRILIDGDHVRDSRGTGISTYARTLGRALRAMGHETAWLSGARTSGEPDVLSDAAAVFDKPEPLRGPRQWLDTATNMIGGLISPSVTARAVNSNVVLPGRSADPSQDFLAPSLYVRSHYRHLLRRQFSEVRVSDQIDALHLTAPLPITMTGVRRIVTIHDLIPLRLPYTTPDNKNEFAARIRRSATEADLVVTVSETSKADLVNLIGLDPAGIAVTYPASDLAPLRESEKLRLAHSLSRFAVEPAGYMLFVGALEPKKNIRRLIEAYLEVDTALPLVLAGPRSWMWEREVGAALAPLGERARKRLRFTGYLPREDLQWLYAGALCFLYPSLYEGFGLPPIDAMAAGCPAIVGRAGSLPEVCGDAALYVDPLDRVSIREGIETMLQDSGLREQLVYRGHLQAARYTFDAFTEQTRAAYERLKS